MLRVFIGQCILSLSTELTFREAEYVKHVRYFAQRIAWYNSHDKHSAHENYQLSQQTRVTASSADSSCVHRALDRPFPSNGLFLRQTPILANMISVWLRGQSAINSLLNLLKL